MIRFKVNPLWCSMGLGGGDVGEHGSDNDPGGSSSSGGGGGGGGAYSGANPDSTAYGGVGTPSERASIDALGGDQHSGDGGSRSSGANLSDITKAMLQSPTAQQYNAYYASQLPSWDTMDDPWGSFSKDLGHLGSYWGGTVKNAISQAISNVLGVPDKVASAFGFGPKADTVDTAFGPMSNDMVAGAPADLGKTNVAELAGALQNLGTTRAITSDEVGLLSGIMEDQGMLDHMTKAGMNLSQVPGQMVSMALGPAVALGAMKMGMDLTNPVVQKAIGIGPDFLGSTLTNTINAQSLIERATGTGIAAGNVATKASEMSNMAEHEVGRTGNERQPGQMSGLGKFQLAGAALNRGFSPTAGSNNPSGGSVKPQEPIGPDNKGNRDGKRAVPMAKRQRGSRLGLSDYMTLTNNLGVGDESVELRNRMLGGA